MTEVEIGLVDRSSADRRRVMVDGQIRTFDVTDQRVLDRFYRVPREVGLPTQLAPFAYSDVPLVLPTSRPGGTGRCLMQPMFLAKMMQGATLEPQHRVLVVAGANGYAAALLAGLVATVVTLESDPALSDLARQTLASLGEGTVTVATGPLEAGYAAAAPYDRILVLGAVERGLEGLFAQLAVGGALLAVDVKDNQATRRSGRMTRFDKVDGEISARALFDATVPVLEGFQDLPAFVF